MHPFSLIDVRLRRGRYQLDVPRLEGQPGQVIGLVGRNGAGKSTIFDLLSGLVAPDAGAVRVFGVDPGVDPVTTRRRAVLMRDDAPVFAMPVGAHLAAIAAFYPAWDAALADALVQRFGLDPAADASRLSKGEGTRFRLVLALAARPDVLLLDEPATGLDVAHRHTMLGEVLEVVRDPARTVVVASHDLADVERISDRIVIVEDGRITADGPTFDVLDGGKLAARLGGAS